MHRKQTFLLEATNGEVTIHVRNAEDVPDQVRGQYSTLVHKAVGTHPALLKRADPEIVFGSDAAVSFVTRGGDLELGMFATRDEDEDGPFLFCKGLVSHERVNGVVPALIAATFVAEARRSGRFASGKAIARILPDGSVNVGSSIGFARLGFFGRRVFTERVTLDQIHRAGSAEHEPHGLVTRALEMYGKAKDIEPRARELLSSWNLTFG